MTNEPRTLKLTLTDPNGKLIQGQIAVAKGLAISTFSDKYLAKKLYDADIKAGKKNILYGGSANAYIEKFPYLNCDEIVKKLTKELKKAGGKLQQ